MHDLQVAMWMAGGQLDGRPRAGGQLDGPPGFCVRRLCQRMCQCEPGAVKADDVMRLA